MTLNIYGQSKKEPQEKQGSWWWWIGPVIVLVALIIWLCGCTTITYYPPKGGALKITNSFFDKKFNKVTFLEDGSFEIEGYQSDLHSMIELSKELAKRIPVTIIP